MAIDVKVTIGGLERLRKAAFENPGLRVAIANAWSIIYRSFVRKRFYDFSRGSGDWPPLKPSTIARRRGGGEGAAILRDTGALFASLQPELGQGGLMQTSPIHGIGFTASLSGNGAYKSGPTLQEVASYHHHGDGRLPKREILVAPDGRTIENMSNHAKRIMVKHLGDR